MVQQGQLLFELDPRPFQAAVDETLAQVRALEAQKVAADKNAARRRTSSRRKPWPRRNTSRSWPTPIPIRPALRRKCKWWRSASWTWNTPASRPPIAGRIGRAMLTKGNLVNAGGSDPVLTTIVAVDPIYVDFNVDERAMQRYQEIGAKPARQGPAAIAPRAEDALNLRPGYGKGISTSKGTSVRRQQVHRGHRGRSWSAGPRRTRTAGFVPGSRVRVRVPVSDKYEAAVVPDSRRALRPGSKVPARSRQGQRGASPRRDAGPAT